MSAALQILVDLMAALPRVEDPLPDSIGLGFPFSMAGVGGVLGNVLWVRQPLSERNRATSVGGLWGFWVGVVFYLALFVNQLLSTE